MMDESGDAASRNRLGSAWARFWFAEVDGLPLAVVRVGFSSAALCAWAGTLPHIPLYYSDFGDFPIAFARAWGSEWFGRLLMPDMLGGATAAMLLAALYGAALVAFLVGWRTRTMGVATCFLTYWFHHRNPSFLTAGDSVLHLSSLYLAAGFLFVAPVDRALSVDRLRALGGHVASIDLLGPTRVPAWPIRLIQIQVAVIYSVSGFWKLADSSWRNGTALWIALASPTFSRFGPPGIAPQVPFAVGTLAVAAWEFLFPLLVWTRATRRGALLVGLAMHFFILVFLNIGVFPLVMIALYPAFLRAEELRALWRIGTRRTSHPPTTPSASS